MAGGRQRWCGVQPITVHDVGRKSGLSVQFPRPLSLSTTSVQREEGTKRTRWAHWKAAIQVRATQWRKLEGPAAGVREGVPPASSPGLWRISSAPPRPGPERMHWLQAANSPFDLFHATCHCTVIQSRKNLRLGSFCGKALKGATVYATPKGLARGLMSVTLKWPPHSCFQVASASRNLMELLLFQACPSLVWSNTKGSC